VDSKNYSRLAWLAAVSMALTQVVSAQQTPADSAPPSETSPAATAPSATYLLKADTEIHLRLLAPVGSKTHKRGDRFALEVARPVIVDGAIVIPAGAQGEGEVVHAAKGGFGGRAGELILVSRFVRVGDQTVKLRSFSAGNGEDRVNLALGLSFAVVGLFVNGKDIALPAGTNVFAKVATDQLLPATLAPGPAAVEAPSLPDEIQTATETNDNDVSQR
jgi:hypothetical protein